MKIPGVWYVTLPAEREQTDVRKMLQKIILGLQRDRYALSEPTELVLGMSYKSKIIFAKFSSDRLFLGSINSLAWKFGLVFGDNLLIFLYKTKVSFINEKTKDFSFYKGKWANYRQKRDQIFTKVNWLSREKVGWKKILQKCFYFYMTSPKLIRWLPKVHSGRAGAPVLFCGAFSEHSLCSRSAGSVICVEI